MTDESNPGSSGDCSGDLDAVFRHVVDLVPRTGQLRRLVARQGEAMLELEWPQSTVVETPGTPAAPAAAQPPVPEQVPDDPHHSVAAPMVGTFYAAAEPGTEPFVRIGQSVRPGQQIGIVEAMKLMNAVEADRAGKVSRILVGDGDPVEFGQPLIALTTDGE